MQRVRLGLVGCGAIADAVHLPILTRRRDLFDVVAVADRDEEAVARVAARFGIGSHHADAGVLVERDDLDAVAITTSGDHAPLVLAALAAGHAVFCEKPLVLARADGQAIQDALDGRKDRLLVGTMKVHDPALRCAQDELAVGGRLRAVDVEVLHPTAEDQLALADRAPGAPRAGIPAADGPVPEAAGRALGEAAARRYGALYVDVLLGSLLHDLAVLRAAGTPVVAVQDAHRWAEQQASPGSLAVTGTTIDDARVDLRWHYLPRHPEYRETVTWHHETGTVELVFPIPYVLRAPTVMTARQAAGAGVSTRRWASHVEPFERQWEAFAEMVTTGTAAIAGVDGAMADVATCQAIVGRLAAADGVTLGGEAADLAVT